MADDSGNFKYAYDKRTGDKLPHKVPESHFDLFPDTLSRTPQQERRDRNTTTPQVASVVEAVNKQEGK